ncbi:MAG: ATP-dependent DNA ligase [Nitrospirae bacterium]|nr:ATP-dependent DNA ligase [Nitrospirota bacterium]
MRFLDLVHDFERLEATSKRLEMFEILADLFRRSAPGEITRIIYLVQGQLLPPFQGLEIGMSEKLLARALAEASGLSDQEVTRQFKQSGDLGKTAERILKRKGKAHAMGEVYERLLVIARESGEGSVDRKVGFLADLLRGASPVEAKYIARFVIGRLRLGVGDQTVLEALSLATAGRQFRPELERAYNRCADLGRLAEVLFTRGEEGIRAIGVTVGYPIRPALCERLPSAEEIVGKIGRCAVEVKYDGFRMQVHKEGDRVEIFSRNLERTTPMFPEVAEAALRQVRAERAIFEGEALAYNEATGELLPFQVTIQRKRKHEVEAYAKEFPLRFFAFDLLYADGVDYTARPYAERREALERVMATDTVMELSQTILTEDPQAIDRFFDEAVSRGLEGIVAKRLDAPYAAGARNFNWIKLKRSYKGELADTVDVCIVGYFRGKGARARFGIGAVLGAVYDADQDAFKTISKIGSGFTEEEWGRLKEALDAIAVDHRPARVDALLEPDVWIVPTYVLTVTADEITRSPMHTCGRDVEGVGYALRFPRAVEFLRADKRPEDSNTVSEVLEMYRMQRHVKVS